MTLASHPADGRPRRDTVDLLPSVAVSMPTGHRAASWLLAAMSLLSQAAAAALWSLLIPGRWYALSGTTVAVVFALLLVRGHFRVRMVPDTLSRVPLIVVAVATGGSAAMLVAAAPILGQPGLKFFVGLLGALFVGSLAGHGLGVMFVRRLWRRGRLRASAIVLGSDDLTREMAIEIDLRKDYGVDVVALVDDASSGRATAQDVVRQLAKTTELTGADRLIIGPASGPEDRSAVQAARWAAAHGLAVFVVPRFFEMGLGLDSMAPDRARGYPLVRVQRAAHPQMSILMKRTFDVVCSALVLLLMSPVAAVVALLIKATSSGPVFFAQERVGQGNRPIMIHKFRSMTASETSDTEWTADTRITTVGGWLRRSNLDELPQLWSILRGDMSLVGPRPERPAFVKRFRAEIDDYDDRHRMPVGLTGLAQIAGLRGDTSIAERVKYDNLYIDQWSLGGDFQILAKTLIAMVRQTAYASEATALANAIDNSAQPPEPEAGLGNVA